MKERGADEAIISGDNCLRQCKTRKRRKEKEGVLCCCKSKRDDDHVGDGVDRLVVFMTPEDDCGSGCEFEDLFDGRPDDEGEVLTGGLKTIHELPMRSNVRSSELLEWD